MILRPGDRVRVATTGDDGFPVVRYGFVGGVGDSQGPVVVMLDGEIGGDVIDRCHLQPVSITNIELCLSGVDLVDEPDLRRGLVALWQAEADTAGLAVDSLRTLGAGVLDHDDSWLLAELVAGGDLYVVRALRRLGDPDGVCVRADPSDGRPRPPAG